jgi:1,4-dihydroxy-2-naphthoate octaprenyltransferase
MGNILAFIYDSTNTSSFTIFFLTLVTAFELQILSNLANDYGDFMKGTDNDRRIGNMRSLQSGVIRPKQMQWMIIFFVVISLVTGVTLLIKAFGELNYPFLFLFALGLVSIAAAVKYTMGKTAYGYKGFGDLAVFIFFGFFAVLASAFLQIGYLKWIMVLPAASTGLLAVGVLNVNNIRDIENDKASGKITIPVRLGEKAAKKYHVILIATALGLLLIFSVIRYSNFFDFIYILGFPLIIINSMRIVKNPPSLLYNGFLKQLSLSTLLLVLLFGASNLLSFLFFSYGIFI